MAAGEEEPAMQVIVLGSGGGPLEHNVTAFLVRSTAETWAKGTVLAVDAGVHLSAIMKLLEEHTSDEAPDATTTNVTSGPFKGLQTPHRSLKANASYVTSSLVDAYLITHPHLDHTSGFIMNTANFQSTGRPKKLAALPPTIEAFKTHIFNNVIWPNLSDENQGVGLITYMRLREGGSPAIGDGDSRGYVEIVDHLGVKAWSISHGHCVETHTHRGSNAGLSLPESASPMLRPQSLPFMQNSPRSDSLMSGPSVQQIRAEIGGFCVYDSCAYFIRDLPTGKELLIFGDVEPDSVSLSPRNRHVWSEAAPMIISGRLAAIFIECSYNDSVTQDRLYGHLAPRYLIEELNVLAEEVEMQRRLHDKENKKRKRVNLVPPAAARRPPPTPINIRPFGPPVVSPLGQNGNPGPGTSPPSPLSQTHTLPPSARPVSDSRIDAEHDVSNIVDGEISVKPRSNAPLKGVKIIVIHVKEKMDDGPSGADVVLAQLLAHEEREGFGCEFIVSHAGQSFHL